MDGYIFYIRQDHITDTIRRAINNPPEIPQGFGARMKTDLTWDLYKIEEPMQEEDLSAEDALNIITGGVV